MSVHFLGYIRPSVCCVFVCHRVTLGQPLGQPNPWNQVYPCANILPRMHQCQTVSFFDRTISTHSSWQFWSYTVCTVYLTHTQEYTEFIAYMYMRKSGHSMYEMYEWMYAIPNVWKYSYAERLLASRLDQSTSRVGYIKVTLPDWIMKSLLSNILC